MVHPRCVFLFSLTLLNGGVSELVKYIVIASKTKDKKDIYTKFRGDIVVDLIEYLEGDVDEE